MQHTPRRGKNGRFIKGKKGRKINRSRKTKRSVPIKKKRRMSRIKNAPAYINTAPLYKPKYRGGILPALPYKGGILPTPPTKTEITSQHPGFGNADAVLSARKEDSEHVPMEIRLPFANTISAIASRAGNLIYGVAKESANIQNSVAGRGGNIFGGAEDSSDAEELI